VTIQLLGAVRPQGLYPSRAGRQHETKGPVRPALWKSAMRQIRCRIRGRRHWWIRRSRYFGYQHPNSLAACLGNPAPRLWCDLGVVIGSTGGQPERQWSDACRFTARL